MTDDLIPRAEADAMVAAAYEAAIDVAHKHRSKIKVNEPLWHDGQDWASDRIADAIRALATADQRAALDEVRREARREPGLRITGPNSDGEYWLHIKVGGRSGGVNLGAEHGPLCKRLLDAVSETGEKE